MSTDTTTEPHAIIRTVPEAPGAVAVTALALGATSLATSVLSLVWLFAVPLGLVGFILGVHARRSGLPADVNLGTIGWITGLLGAILGFSRLYELTQASDVLRTL